MATQCVDCEFESDDAADFRDCEDGNPRCEACWEEWDDHRELMEANTMDGDDYLIDGVGFQDPGGKSALRRATKRNPRNLPCPTCKQPNRLTPADVRAGYQCDGCADRDEGVGP